MQNLRFRDLTPALLLAAFGLLAASGPDDLRARAVRALAQIDGTIAVHGLRAPVEVIRDTWGVPHIYARNQHDLFFAQGFVAAQDRLWQLDMWRRAAEGKLAEVLGEKALDRDTFARLLRYRGDMNDEWRSYSEDAAAIADAFVAGINAQVAFVNAAPEKRPIEFQLTGTRPEPWTRDVVISRLAGYVMTGNARSEIGRARVARAVGAPRTVAFMPVEPGVEVTVPSGVDLADVTPDILAVASEADAPFVFAEEPALVGSNNWVVTGARAAGGRPMLANDPHRALRLPSLRYTTHLNAPGWNVIGAGEPALPGVAAGHNDRIAFGFTIVGIDQQDVVIERLHPADAGRYDADGTWVAMRVERERVMVRGGSPREVVLRFTRNGPVLHVDEARRRAYVLRWVGAEPGTAGYLASLTLNRVGDWPGFLRAMARWKVPSENIVYADVDGNIGWVAAGLAPVRRNSDGLLPVTGEARYRWQGFLPVRDLPQSFNPASGYIATANHNILPRGYPKALGYEWSAPFRYQRIRELIEGGARKFTVEDFERMQHDERSVAARRIVELLKQALAQPGVLPEADAQHVVELLTGWDGTLSSDSAAAAVYELWLPHLGRAAIAASFAGEERALVSRPSAPETIIRLLEALDPARRAWVLTGTSLAHAWADAAAQMGPEDRTWSWGRVHRSRFQHPLATSADRAALFNLSEYPRGGDGTTPNATGTGPWQTHGASFREVIDLADWDRSTTVNVPGQSGQPGSRFYDNLYPLWAAGKYHPMLFTRAAVEKHAAHRLALVPATRQ